ncbi:hypothetical protein [Streptomyces sp. NPDC087297]|uniref:hypothetical protein n=1 Tax=Streptomyces sp. NPDC087297 TaxID=3365778 RepID=UPI0037F25F78
MDATLHALTTTPPSAPPAPASRLRLSPTAARSRPTTPGQPAPSETAVPAHRQQPAPRQERGTLP